MAPGFATLLRLDPRCRWADGAPLPLLLCRWDGRAEDARVVQVAGLRIVSPHREGLESSPSLELVTPTRYNRRVDTTIPTNPPLSTDPGTSASERRSTSYAQDKSKILARLRRIEGQVRGVQRMVEEDQYCVDVLTQLSAIIAAARSAGLLVLEDHIRGCVLGTCHHDHQDQEETLAELTSAIERFTRSAG